MAGWEAVESEGAYFSHAPFADYEEAIGYVILRIDRFAESGWTVVRFHEGPPPWIRLCRGRESKTLEVRKIAGK